MERIGVLIMDQAYCDALRFAFEYEKSGEKHYREAAEAANDRRVVDGHDLGPEFGQPDRQR